VIVQAASRFAHRQLERARASRKDRALSAAAELFAGASALEPGGPSTLFERGNLVPIYPQLATLDTLDFAERTIWSESQDGVVPGRRLIAEAGRLDEVADDAYDAVLASHVLEHLANPLGALAEWRRVVRPGGHILLIVPHRDGTFDHQRPVTSLAHLREDAEHQTGEDDLTHLQEIVELHDLARDPGAPDRQAFEQRCRENPTLRAMHHHIFVSRTVVETCRAAGLEVLLLRPKRPFHIVCLCRVNTQPAGEGLSDLPIAETLRRSPFPSDKHERRIR
jgi:SAM-dependent methyltransferase